MVTIHAEGAQIYECKADSGGKLVWQFREPIAALILDGKTVGRHYAGPNWELADGSAVSAKMSARAPGTTAKDIPLLKLEVTSQRGKGQLTGRGSTPREVWPKARVRPAAPSRACPIRPTTRSSRKEAERGLCCFTLWAACREDSYSPALAR